MRIRYWTLRPGQSTVVSDNVVGRGTGNTPFHWRRPPTTVTQDKTRRPGKGLGALRPPKGPRRPTPVRPPCARQPPAAGLQTIPSRPEPAPALACTTA